MNGLKCIRINCNISIGKLANILDVSRQALNSWESGKKEISQRRREQLAEYFGIGAQYFGEISEKEKQYILEKAMFRYYDETGKEYFLYKPPEGVENLFSVGIRFSGDKKISDDDEYALARKRKGKVLKRVEEIIKGPDNVSDVRSRTSSIDRGCAVYAAVTGLMEEKDRQKIELKVDFFNEIINILKAMFEAYGIEEPDDLKRRGKPRPWGQEEDEWYDELAKQFRAHWEYVVDFQEKRLQEVLKDGLGEYEDADTPLKSLEEQIKEAEEKYREIGRTGLPENEKHGNEREAYPTLEIFEVLHHKPEGSKTSGCEQENLT